MADADERRASFQAWTDTMFDPGFAPGFHPSTEERRAQALQYIAAQLWHIRQAIETIAQASKAHSDGTPPAPPQ